MKKIMIILIVGIILISVVFAGLGVDLNVSLEKEQKDNLEEIGITSPKFSNITCEGEVCKFKLKDVGLNKVITMQRYYEVETHNKDLADCFMGCYGHSKYFGLEHDDIITACEGKDECGKPYENSFSYTTKEEYTKAQLEDKRGELIEEKLKKIADIQTKRKERNIINYENDGSINLNEK